MGVDTDALREMTYCQCKQAFPPVGVKCLTCQAADELDALRAERDSLQKRCAQLEDELAASAIEGPPLDQVEYDSLPAVLRRRHDTLREEYNAGFLRPILVAAAEIKRTRQALGEREYVVVRTAVNDTADPSEDDEDDDTGADTPIDEEEQENQAA